MNWLASLVTFPKFIEEHVSSLGNDFGRVCPAYLGIVELVPALSNGVHAESGVVTPIQTSVVVADAVEVIHNRLSLVVIEDILGEVKTLHWTIHLLSNLPGTENGLALMGEPLEMDNEVLGASVDFHFLESVLVSFTGRTEPLIVASEGFLLAEPTEAVI